MTTYKMPPADVGQAVYWYIDGRAQGEPYPALVTRRANRGVDTVGLAVMTPDSRLFMLREGVRHCDDPRLKEAERVESGCWDYTDRDKKLQGLLLSLETKGKV